ncbi:MAG: hypothetical protein IT178_15380 [Acidobacteria bacterium]|nr:hypothetical protein [Acidobacteriota bacterium]
MIAGLCATAGPAYAQQSGRQDGRRQEGRPQQPEPPPPEEAAEPLTGAERPMEALFAGASTGQRRALALDFNGAVSAVNDSDVVTGEQTQIDGFYTNLIADLVFERRTGRTETGATAGGNVRYYPELKQFIAADYHVGTGVAGRVTPRTMLRVDSAASLAPIGLPGLFATALPPDLGEPLPPGTNYAVNNDRLFTWTGLTSFEQRFTARSQLVMRAGGRASQFLTESLENNDWWNVEAGGMYRYRVTTTRSVRTNYTYRRASFGTLSGLDIDRQNTDEHVATVGGTADYLVSDQQRTMFSAQVGISTVSLPLTIDGDGASRRHRVIGDVSVAHQMGRSWLLVGTVERSNRFDQGFGGPVFTNGGSLALNGFFNTRTDVSATFSHTTGRPSLAGADQRFWTTGANGRLRFALSRSWALSAEYMYFAYNFRDAPGLPSLIGVPQQFKRHSVRAGIVTSLPWLRR